MDIADKNRILELDALRGLAALFVVVFHLTMGKEHSQMGFKYGVTGVDLFFMISGFLIFLTLKQIKHWKVFVVNRVARLFPTYWIAVTFTFFLLFAFHCYHSLPLMPLIKQYLANMTMLQYYMLVPDLDGPYWTMIVELVFYVMMLLIFRFKLLNRIQWLGLLILLFTIVGELVIAPNFPFLHKLIGLACPLINHFPLFFAGILFYNIRNNMKNSYTYLLLLSCYITQVMLLDNGGNSHAFVSIDEYATILLLYFFIFALFVTNNLKWLINPLTVFLGTISYPLYLFHQMLSIKFILPFLTDVLQLSFWLSVFLAALIAIGIASFITFFIEEKASKKIKLILQKWMSVEKDKFIVK